MLNININISTNLLTFLPVNGFYLMLLQILVANTEMVIAKEATIGRQWRGVGRPQDAMFGDINERRLALCITAP